MKTLAFIALLGLTSCSQGPVVVANRAPDIAVQVHQVRLNVAFVPEAQVMITNNDTSSYSYVTVKCIFYRADGSLIGEGIGITSNLAAGAHDVVDVTSVERNQIPARAECRIENVA